MVENLNGRTIARLRDDCTFRSSGLSAVGVPSRAVPVHSLDHHLLAAAISADTRRPTAATCTRISPRGHSSAPGTFLTSGCGTGAFALLLSPIAGLDRPG